MKQFTLLKQKLQLIAVILSCSLSAWSQSGIKWSTGGNLSSPGDVLGTTNNQPIDFRTNNVQRMVLGTSGVLKINGLAGTGNRLLQTDPSGNITAFPMGGATQVLFGNGTWGNLPPTSSVWSVSGSNIYYNSGNVGIGTSSPLTALDVRFVPVFHLDNTK